MSRRTISFSGTSLQTSYIVSQEFDHESINGKDSNYQRLGARDGAKLTNVTFDVKDITIKGIIKGDDINDLESRIDTLKALLNQREKNLDIQYASGTRRYNSSMIKLEVDRKHFHVTHAPFEAVFRCANPPHGTSLDTSTAEYNSVTLNSTGTYSGSVTFTGSYRPFPIIRCNINTANNLRGITFRNVQTDSEITVTEDFNNGDVLLIDTQDSVITLNGVALVDYQGVFPDFVQGGNDFRVHFDGNYFSVDVKLIYRPLYL